MIIHSLYITNFRGINRQAFHLSSKYIIDFSGTPDDLEIIIKVNPKHIDNFFGYEELKSVTAIIGQNGAGKTSTLDYIKSNFSKGNGDLPGYSIIILEKDLDDQFDGREELKRIYYPSHWNVNIRDETKSFIPIDVLMNKEGGVVDWDKIDAFENTSIVFYSNIFDGKNEIEREGYYDISTNFLLRKDQEKYNGINQVDAFNDSELLRQLLFLSSETPQKIVPFDLPNTLNVSVLADDEIFLRKPFEELGLKLMLNSLTDTSYVFRRSSGYEDFFLTEIYIGCFLNFIRNDIESRSSVLRDSFNSLSLLNIKEAIDTFFYNISRNREHPYSQKASFILDFLGYTDYLIKRQILYVGGQLPSHSLRINEYRSEIETFLNKYILAKAFTNFLKFEWRDLSSGQKSLLSLFSRFYSLTDKVNASSMRLEKNVLMLIDEGDLYFHPEWQRKYFKILIDFLASIFPKKNLQLILASNSPFIASDLPKSNVIFIDKDRNVLPFINSREETFASNIHSLFADSFFMEEILIGDFAKSKIDAVIEYLNRNEFSNEMNEKYRAIVDIIGEPVIKYKIEELWIEKLGKDEEIKILQNRIIKLREET